MATRKNWFCPSCGVHATLGGEDRHESGLGLFTGTGSSAGEGILLKAQLTRCPNSACLRSAFHVDAYHGKFVKAPYGGQVDPDFARPVGIGHFQFLPTTPSPLSSHVPNAVRADYEEAYLIRALSPKASATLARRALQGMIRDFWNISKPTLAAELVEIKDLCEFELYEAMTALKGIGNIGAHPERDVNLIVEIEPGEAQQLLDLIHLLDEEWYVARAARAKRISRVSELGKGKAAAKVEARTLLEASKQQGTSPTPDSDTKAV